MDQLFQYAVEGNVEQLTLLLDENTEFVTEKNSHGISLLIWAMYHRQRPAAEMIYRRLVAPTVDEMIAVDDVSGLESYLIKNPDAITAFSGDGFTLLHYACFFNNASCVEILLRNKAQVNCAANNPSKVFPLHSAAAAQESDIVSLLLSNGANPNVQQAGGFTALMSAAAHNNLALIDVLLIGGADKLITDDDGKNAYDHGAEKDFRIAVLSVEG